MDGGGPPQCYNEIKSLVLIGLMFTVFAFSVPLVRQNKIAQH